MAARQFQVGDELELVREVDAYRAIYYAAASGDFNPIHIDAEVGRRAGLGGAILQGLCTLGWMVESVVRFTGDAASIAKCRARFTKPVAIGDVVTFRGKVAAIDAGLMTVEVAAKNQRGEDVLKGGVVEARVGDRRNDDRRDAATGGARRWGPFRYEVGAEKVREFALALSGGVPSPIYPHALPADLPKGYADGTLAPPTFCVTYAIQPFIAAMFDRELALDLLMLVHGEQELEWFEPVRSGDALETHGHLADHYEKNGREFVVVKTTSTNQHGREVVRGTWTAVIRKS